MSDNERSAVTQYIQTTMFVHHLSCDRKSYGTYINQ